TEVARGPALAILVSHYQHSLARGHGKSRAGTGIADHQRGHLADRRTEARRRVGVDRSGAECAQYRGELVTGLGCRHADANELRFVKAGGVDEAVAAGLRIRLDCKE